MTPAKNVTAEAKFGGSPADKWRLWLLFAREDLRNGWVRTFLIGGAIATILARLIPPVVIVPFTLLYAIPLVYAMAANRLGAARFRGAMSRILAQADRAGKSAFPLELLLGQIVSFAILTLIAWIYLTLALRWDLADPVLRYFLADMAVMGFLTLGIGVCWPRRPLAALFAPASIILIFYVLSSVVRPIFAAGEFQFRFAVVLTVISFVFALAGLRRHIVSPWPR